MTYVENYYIDSDVMAAKYQKVVNNLFGKKDNSYKCINENGIPGKQSSNKMKQQYWWTGKPSFACLEKFVRKEETDEAMKHMMDNMLIMYKRACISIHASCLGNSLRLKNDNESHIIDILPSSDQQPLPLYFSLLSFIGILGVTCDTLGFDAKSLLQ